MMREILSQLLSDIDNRKQVIFAALVETRGSTPQKPGAAMLVYPDGGQFGTLGGGCVEAEVKRRALTADPTQPPQLLTFQLDHDYGWDDGLICGGRMTMLVDPQVPLHADYYRRYAELLDLGAPCCEAIRLDPENAQRALFSAQGELLAQIAAPASEIIPPPAETPVRRPVTSAGVTYLPHAERCRLVIIGAGHVGCELAKYAADVDFDVTVVDDRDDYCNPERLPMAQSCVTGNFDETLPALDLNERTLCVIVTRGHNHDQTALFHLINRDVMYLGMIGSRRKIKLIFENLQELGVSSERLAAVRAPIGLDIGSQTVPEIAISIVAELIGHRSGRLPG